MAPLPDDDTGLVRPFYALHAFGPHAAGAVDRRAAAAAGAVLAAGVADLGAVAWNRERGLWLPFGTGDQTAAGG